MKRSVTCCVLSVFAASLAVSMAACTPSDVDKNGKAFSKADITYAVDATVSNAEEDQISDLLYGVFLEDINYAGYALDDNLLCNGSFEYSSDSFNRWKTSSVTATTSTDSPVVSTNKTYANLSVSSSGAKLTNNGYNAVPIAVTEGVSYDFSAFIRATDYSGKVTISVTDGTTTYASGSFTVSQSSDWVKYKATVTATGSASESLKFVIEFGSTGTLDIDSVALETQDSTGGIKNYVYQAIADLSPKFIRFPGGCVIEGKTEDSAYDWKNSIGVNENDEVASFTYTVVEDGVSTEVTTRGEAATRTPNTDIWQNASYYLMDYAIGFYEYFLLCDNLGASAIPIVNCGLSCMTQSSGTALSGRYNNGIDDYIQDALDLVAFAKGDPNSSDANEAYWAQVRVDMGHEEPFDMTYLGIGNEQWGSSYYNYYQQFLVAFEEATEDNPDLYGDIELIVGNGTTISNCEGYSTSMGTAQAAATTYMTKEKISSISEYGVHDHHYYMNYTDFFTYSTLYDSYSRTESTRYNVFVGEYSANSATSVYSQTYDFTANSWITALSEAAYMTGLERNADVVKLAAYAPMFGNYTDNQWAADMMFFTNTQIVFTPNYYVQQMFSCNQGSTVLSTEATYKDGYEKAYKLYTSDGKDYTEVTKVYQIVSVDSATGDIIIKIVNASSEDVDINVEISNATLTGKADVTVLQCDDTTAVNSLTQTNVSPETYVLGVSKKFGYTAEAYSVTVIRAHVS